MQVSDGRQIKSNYQEPYENDEATTMQEQVRSMHIIENFNSND